MPRLRARTIVIGLVSVLAAVVVVGYLGVLGYIYFDQRALQYDATGAITPLNQTKLLTAQEVAIPTGDGQVVNGWYQAPDPGEPSILYYKGNSGSFTEEHARYEAWTADGYGFLAFDYRGFPDSTGTISQDHILTDALAAYDWLKGQHTPIVIWGRSLGSGPATYVASRRPADALLLETPFLSAVDVAFDRYPYLPVHWLMFDQFPVKEWITQVRAPVLVAHGTADHTIDVHHGKAVYALAPNKYELWIVPGADHSDLWAAGIWDKAKAFFTAAEARRQRALTGQ